MNKALSPTLFLSIAYLGTGKYNTNSMKKLLFTVFLISSVSVLYAQETTKKGDWGANGINPVNLEAAGLLPKSSPIPTGNLIRTPDPIVVNTAGTYNSSQKDTWETPKPNNQPMTLSEQFDLAESIFGSAKREQRPSFEEYTVNPDSVYTKTRSGKYIRKSKTYIKTW